LILEEFRQQLGDRVPLAMRALEKSTGKTSGELEKMMEQGQLTTEYIKPLVMAMGELAEANGAYEKALKKLGTVENRLKTTAGLSAAKIAEAGFTKGLINLYETLIDSMNENGATLTRIGKIYEKVFNGITNVVKVVSVIIEGFVRTLESMWIVMK
jgi:phage tail tape-measure protein